MVVEVQKSVLKQGAVQHLYGKLAARLRPGSGDAHLLAALHPTPAVCGRPREEALALLAASEPFDRGYYAGPFGWISQDAAEFVVAIRSALVRPGEAAGGLSTEGTAAGSAAAAEALQQRLDSHVAAGPGPGSAATATTAPGLPGHSSSGSSSSGQATGAASGLPPGGRDTPAWHASLFAGVGIVRGSDAASEWAELDLKVRQYERLLQSAPPLAAAPNINALWAGLLVEELCRLGCNTFCVAPGGSAAPATSSHGSSQSSRGSVHSRALGCLDGCALPCQSCLHCSPCFFLSRHLRAPRVYSHLFVGCMIQSSPGPSPAVPPHLNPILFPPRLPSSPCTPCRLSLLPSHRRHRCPPPRPTGALH